MLATYWHRPLRHKNGRAPSPNSIRAIHKAIDRQRRSFRRKAVDRKPLSLHAPCPLIDHHLHGSARDAKLRNDTLPPFRTASSRGGFRRSHQRGSRHPTRTKITGATHRAPAPSCPASRGGAGGGPRSPPSVPAAAGRNRGLRFDDGRWGWSVTT